MQLTPLEQPCLVCRQLSWATEAEVPTTIFSIADWRKTFLKEKKNRQIFVGLKTELSPETSEENNVSPENSAVTVRAPSFRESMGRRHARQRRLHVPVEGDQRNCRLSFKATGRSAGCCTGPTALKSVGQYRPLWSSLVPKPKTAKN